MLASEELENKMSTVEKNAWKVFRLVVKGFLGNNNCENYKELMENFIECYGIQGYRMLVKLHYLDLYLDSLRENLGDVSEEHYEQFHQEILTMTKRCQGRRNESMMGDCV